VIMIGFPAPADLRRRALFCSQLSTMLEAGLALPRSLQTLAGSASDTPERRLATRWLDGLGAGLTCADALEGLGGRFADGLDLALVRAGEQSGRLDQMFALLARHYHARADNLAVIFQSSVYPLLVLHVTAFIAPLPAFVRTGNGVAYLARSAGVLALMYAVGAAAVWACRPWHPWRGWVERMGMRVPLLGPARADLAVSRLAWSLEALLSAGVVVTEAWPIAARASGSPVIESAVSRWRPSLDSGATPAELVTASGIFPEGFVGSYAAGEASGRLEQELGRLARWHEEEGFRRLRLFAMWSPRVLYALVCAWVVLEIVSIASGYFSVLGQLLEE